MTNFVGHGLLYSPWINACSGSTAKLQDGSDNKRCLSWADLTDRMTAKVNHVPHVCSNKRILKATEKIILQSRCSVRGVKDTLWNIEISISSCLQFKAMWEESADESSSCQGAIRLWRLSKKSMTKNDQNLRWASIFDPRIANLSQFHFQSNRLTADLPLV